MVQGRLLGSFGSAWQRADTIDAFETNVYISFVGRSSASGYKIPRQRLLSSPVGTVVVLPILLRIYIKRNVALFSWTPCPEFLRTVPGVFYARGDIVRPLCVEAYSRPSACADTLQAQGRSPAAQSVQKEAVLS